MTPEFASLDYHGRTSTFMLLARDAAMKQDGKAMQNWLAQARMQYEKFLIELVTICERLPQ